MKKLLMLLLILFIACPVFGALTKTRTQVDEWAETAQNAVREGAVIDISDSYSTVGSVSWAVTSATAHTGTKFEVQASMNTSGDEDWTTITFVTVGVGTPNPEATSGTESGGDTVIEVASTTGLYDDDGTRWIFIESTTVANSELLLLVSHVADTSVTVMDATANDHTASTLYDIAGTWPFSIPMGYNRARVIVDNTVDSDGATCHNKVEVSEVTSLN